MQYFYIKQGSTLPTLRMELIEDGRHDFNKFHECIQAAEITFTMTNIDTNVVKVAKNKGKVTFKKRSGSSKRLTISKAGVITVKKGTKKGTYKIRVRATARGNSNYRKGYKNVTVKVRVK